MERRSRKAKGKCAARIWVKRVVMTPGLRKRSLPFFRK